MVGYNYGSSSSAPVAAAAGNTTPGASTLVNATAAGATVVGLYAVTLHNEGAVIATVQGASLASGATVSWTAPGDLGLPSISYDPGAGGSLKITTQSYSTP